MHRLNLKVEELEERIAPSNGAGCISIFATAAPGSVGAGFSSNASAGNSIPDFIQEELREFCQSL